MNALETLTDTADDVTLEQDEVRERWMKPDGTPVAVINQLQYAAYRHTAGRLWATTNMLKSQPIPADMPVALARTFLMDLETQARLLEAECRVWEVKLMSYEGSG